MPKLLQSNQVIIYWPQSHAYSSQHFTFCQSNQRKGPREEIHWRSKKLTATCTNWQMPMSLFVCKGHRSNWNANSIAAKGDFHRKHSPIERLSRRRRRLTISSFLSLSNPFPSIFFNTYWQMSLGSSRYKTNTHSYKDTGHTQCPAL